MSEAARVRVSVCLATYNGEKFLLEQLKSILIQLSAIDEIIISDDGSVDRTCDIVAELKDDRIKFIINENSSKKGPLGNFENALKHAEGEIIFLSDQDDLWLPGKLKAHLDYHKNYDLIVSDAIVVNEVGEVLFESFFNQRGSRPGLINNIVKNSYIGCCMSFNRNILNYALPFPPGIHMHDWWIGLIGERFGRVFFQNQKTLKYLRHEANASQTLIKKLPIVEQIRNRWMLTKHLLKLKRQ
jgi:glycosyltransferase involved in cell wall biosynthesis